MPLTEKEIEGHFRRFNTAVCDLLEGMLKDQFPSMFDKTKKIFLRESKNLKYQCYQDAGLSWEKGKDFYHKREVGVSAVASSTATVTEEQDQ